MGIGKLIERFKERRQQAAERGRSRRELRQDEKAADKAAHKTAISEARQMRREQKAEYIKKKYGTYTPLSEKIKAAGAKLKEARAERLKAQQPSQSTYRRTGRAAKRKSRKSIRPLSNNLLSSNRVATGQTGGINFGFGGPNMGEGGTTRDIITGKPYKRR